MVNFKNSEDVKKEIVKKQKEFLHNIGNVLSPMGFIITDCNIGFVEFGLLDSNGLWLVCKTKISIERDQFNQGEYKLVTNFGATGAFNMEDSDTANFYIQVGKLLGDSSLLKYIKDALISYETTISELQKKFS